MIQRLIASACLLGLWGFAAFGYGRNSSDRDGQVTVVVTVLAVVVGWVMWG